MKIPVLTVLIALPLLGGILAGFMRDRDGARRVGVSTGWATLVLSLGVALAFDRVRGGIQLMELVLPLGGEAARPLLGVDSLAVPLLPLTALVALAILIASPRAQVNEDGVAAVLTMTSATLGLMLARNLALLVLFWVGTVLPGLFRILRMPAAPGRSAMLRSYAVFIVGTTAPLMIAAWMVGSNGWQAHRSAPLDLSELAALGTPPEHQMAIFVLLLLTVAVRKGVFPFHSWLPIFAERGPTDVTTMLVGVHTAVFIGARLILPLAPDAAAVGMPYAADVALVGGLIGSLLALAQTDLKRMIGYIAVSQAGLLLVGLASLNSQSVAGALMQSMGIGLATSSMYLMVRVIEARTGTTDVRYMGGLVARAPRAAALFFVFAVAAAGFPGSPGFVGEDLLVHGVIDAHPVVATVMVVITALNGITLVRAFVRAFLGRPRHRARTEGPLPIEDLLPRERHVALALAATLLLAGLRPAPLLDVRDEAVRSLVGASAEVAAAHEE